MTPKWLEIARKYKVKGVREILGPRDNPDIIEFLKSTKLPKSMLHDETAWCAAFVCSCLEQAGLKSTDSAAAASFLNWGEELEYGREGCVVLIPRDGGSGYHVGFYEDENVEGVIVLGGNQSNMVCSKQFAWDRIERFRWPTAKEGYIVPPATPLEYASVPAPASESGGWQTILRSLWNVLGR